MPRLRDTATKVVLNQFQDHFFAMEHPFSAMQRNLANVPSEVSHVSQCFTFKLCRIWGLNARLLLYCGFL